MMGMNSMGGMGLGGSSPSLGGMRSGLMGSAMNDPLNQGGGQLGSGGGMDVLGSLRQHSNFATQFQRNPAGSAMSGPAMGGYGGW